MKYGLHRSAARSLFLSSLGCVLVACGAGSDRVPYAGPRGPEAFDACELFPASEALAELPDREIGQLTGPLDASSGTQFARCAYGHGPGANLDAALDVRRHEDPAALRRKLEAALPMLRRLSAGDLSAVSGVGDIAWWAGGELRVLKVGWRDLELTVTLQPGGGPESPRAVAERIARRAVYRLAGEPVPGELLPAPRGLTLGAAEEAPSVEPAAKP
ncbi:MAG: hypothetical protein QG573_314 [Acidobacteriota bacterium]|nr:hypothetical protein [Acidobacteriota bacterium]